MLFVRAFSNKQNKPCRTVAWVPTLRVFLAGNIDLPLSILLHCHFVLSEVKTPNPGV